MIKKRKLARNLIFLTMLIFVYIILTGASLTPLAAHRRLERSENYGPSNIVKTQKIEGCVLYLCKYDKWFSLDTVKRGSLLLWYGNNIFVAEENTEPINFTASRSFVYSYYAVQNVYGIVNDPNIKSVKLEIKHLHDPIFKTLEQNELYDNNMFWFVLDKSLSNYMLLKLTGLDKDGKVIYERTNNLNTVN